ncbi:YidH family protein [Nocardioides sp. L-11A]|uniref:YidH family protein n=1 Tax=Nocardioides sp. L-11A TaxID=3043848 RepID=UPI00249C6BBF|nr:DUF202 domain-containing protein [Nocardioides sp. L-11A]
MSYAGAGRPRFPRTLYGEGSEPDPRFTMANERTFLAWIRTALALLAAGVTLAVVDLGLQEELRIGAATVFLVGGVAVPGQAWCGWLRTERALRRDLPLHPTRMMLSTVVAVTVGGALAGLAALVG